MDLLKEQVHTDADKWDIKQKKDFLTGNIKKIAEQKHNNITVLDRIKAQTRDVKNKASKDIIYGFGLIFFNFYGNDLDSCSNNVFYCRVTIRRNFNCRDTGIGSLWCI